MSQEEIWLARMSAYAPKMYSCEYSEAQSAYRGRAWVGNVEVQALAKTRGEAIRRLLHVFIEAYIQQREPYGKLYGKLYDR